MLHFHPLYDCLGDLLDAIVAKEARQMVFSRFVAAGHFTLPSFLLLALGSDLIKHEPLAQDRAFGRNMLVCFQSMLHAVCLIGVPMRVVCRLAFERPDANADLLFSTSPETRIRVSSWPVSQASAFHAVPASMPRGFSKQGVPL